MELACGCFKAKPNPQEISNLEQARCPAPMGSTGESGGVRQQWREKYMGYGFYIIVMGKICGIW
jgi:hypothetical protein